MTFQTAMIEERQFQLETNGRLQVSIGDLSILSFQSGAIEIWIDGRKAERVRDFELSGGVGKAIVLKLTQIMEPTTPRTQR